MKRKESSLHGVPLIDRLPYPLTYFNGYIITTAEQAEKPKTEVFKLNPLRQPTP